MSTDGPSSLRRMTSVQVLAGPGIVGRYGDVVVWMEEGRGGGGAVATGLLALARALALVDGPDARQAGARVAEILRSDPEAVPAMVLVAPTPDGIQAIVHGWGRVVADGVDIDGGWADREIPWTTALAAGRGGDLLRVPTPGSILDLRQGSTPGGGAAVALTAREGAPPLLPQPEPPPPIAPEPEIPRPISISPPLAAPPIQRTPPQPAATAPAAFEAIDLRAAPAARDPLPVGGRGDAVSPAAGITVKGVVCSRGHFNNPIALFCGTCGTSMGQVARILQDGIRPSLGTLVLDDGTAFGLDTDHLVGSAPDAEAAGGTARPVTLVDAHNQIAAVHAEVRLVGWDVVLVARAPTFLLPHGTQQWTPVPPGQPTPLPAGARVALSQRTFVVESNAQSSGV